jgi:hypothetical protein
MAARDALDVEVGVRVPVPQFEPGASRSQTLPVSCPAEVRTSVRMGRQGGRGRGGTRAAVEALLAEGLTQAEIARRLGVSRPTVCFHARGLGVAARPELAKRHDWAEIQAWYQEGHSARECCLRFGVSRSAWSDAVRRGAIQPRPRATATAAMLVSGRRCNRHHLKNRLLVEGLKAAACESCGLTVWRGRPVCLELHHVNGDGLDNRLENLQLLCPNCHSQTDTWGGLNRRRKQGSG